MSKWIVLGALSLSLISSLANTQAFAQTFNGAVQRAIATNPKVLAARENRLSIDQAITQARSGFLPQVRLQASYGPENSINANTIAAVLNKNRAKVVNMPVRQIGMTLDQMLFDGFATSGEVKRNISRANSAAYQLLAAMQDTAIGAITAYYDILREQRQVQVAEENVEAHRGYLGMIHDRARNGLSNKADLIQIQGRLAYAISNLEAEKSNLRDAYSRYEFVVGEFPENLVEPPEAPPGAIPQTKEEAAEFASHYNPTVLFAMQDLAATYQQYEVAKARNFPRFDVEFGIDRNTNVGGVRGPDNDQYAFLKLNYDIYTGGAIVGRQRETVYLMEQARQIMLNSYRQARQDTQLTWNMVDSARRILPNLREYMDSTSNTIGAYKDQFQLSRRSLIDLLDVQNEHYTAARSYVETEYKIKLGEYQLLHNLGNLIQSMNYMLPLETFIYVYRP